MSSTLHRTMDLLFSVLVGLVIAPSLIWLYFVQVESKSNRENQAIISVEDGRDEPNSKALDTEINRSMPTAQHENHPGSMTPLYKELYLKVQNLESYPEILPKARRTLFQLLSEGLQIERSQPRERSILDVGLYDSRSLESFLIAEHDSVTNQWEEYASRRAAGGQPELFDCRQSAIEWLKQHAPTKYVDGAWLGHVHTVTTPFILRGVSKDAWQILSEELGDGDLEKNHVFLYRQLLEDVGVSLPDGNDIEFIHPRHGLNDELVWKAGTAQLLISLFPHDFLPEILGFNLHYELLTMETLLASKELPEFQISGYYFTLHVSIDNADSGHTAMALGIVTRYLEIVQRESPWMVQDMWKRIQAGYVLSKVSNENIPLSKEEHSLIQIIRSKANVSHQLHCRSRAKVGGHSLVEWLSPTNWTGTEKCKRRFLQDLANARPWVVKGDHSKSSLVKELSWKGRMFGAFTDAEMQALKAWIDGLKTVEPNYEMRYWSDLQIPARYTHSDKASIDPSQDVAVDHPVFPPQPILRDFMPEPELVFNKTKNLPPLRPFDLGNVCVDQIIPLWFVHPCLLENMVSTPFRAATYFASHVLRILRAESGFLEEGPGVAGMSEQLQPQRSPSLISLGLEMIERLKKPRPTSLKDILGDANKDAGDAINYSRDLLAFSARPVRNRAVLVGLSLAFLDLEAAVAYSEKLLSQSSQDALQDIVKRKRNIFRDGLTHLDGRILLEECVPHYKVGRLRISEALGILNQR